MSRNQAYISFSKLSFCGFRNTFSLSRSSFLPWHLWKLKCTNNKSTQRNLVAQILWYMTTYVKTIDVDTITSIRLFGKWFRRHFHPEAHRFSTAESIFSGHVDPLDVFSTKERLISWTRLLSFVLYMEKWKWFNIFTGLRPKTKPGPPSLTFRQTPSLAHGIWVNLW